MDMSLTSTRSRGRETSVEVVDLLHTPVISNKSCGFMSITVASKLTRCIGFSRPTVLCFQAKQKNVHCQMNKVSQTIFLLYLILECLSACVIKMKQNLDCDIALEPIALVWPSESPLIPLFVEGVFCVRHIPCTTQWGVGEITCLAGTVLTSMVLHLQRHWLFAVSFKEHSFQLFKDNIGSSTFCGPQKFEKHWIKQG